MPEGDQVLQLEQLRRRLLDLTLRNRLLNYPHPPGRSLRLIDTDPDWLVSELLSGSSLRIEDVAAPPRGEALERAWPDWVARNGSDARPSVRDWAIFKGLDTDFDLKKHCGRGGQRTRSGRIRSVQALHYPEALEAQLNKIAQIARTAIEDSGANILYLAVGFLSWSEKEDSSKVIAPLFLVPVTLESKGYDKETRRKIYTLSHNGEDLQENLSLREKLQRDFHINLPQLEEDDSVSTYLDRCQRLTKANPGWKVHHYATLGFFQFGKLLLYLDLDPKRWPENSGPLNHPVIAKVLGVDDGGANGFEYAAPLSPDELDTDAPEFKLVQSADSSQHSVVVDAANGKDLVVEGPPGTGKSQTITNIIAVALMKGQSVLFVSEKMAALDVVRRRLDSVGLGDFCLELHSHRTQRKKLLEDIEKRIRRRPGQFPDGELQSAIKKFKKLRKKLNRYADLINSNVSGYFCSVHSLFWQVAQLRSGGIADIAIADAFRTGGDLSQDDLEDAKHQLGVSLRRRREIAAEVGELRKHPLFGLAIDREKTPTWLEARMSVEAVRDSLHGLINRCGRVAGLTTATIDLSLRGLAPLASVSAVVEDPVDVERTVKLRALVVDGTAHTGLREFVAREIEYRKNQRSASASWRTELLDDARALATLIGQIAKLGAGRIPGSSMSIEQLSRVAEIARALVDLFRAHDQQFKELEQTLGFSFPEGLTGLRAAEELLTIIKAAPSAVLSLRTPILEVVNDDVLLARMEHDQSRLKEDAARLSLRFNLEQSKQCDSLRYAAGFLKRKSLLVGQFDDEWRASNRIYRGICIASPWLRSAAKRASDLDAIADYLDALAAFEGNADYAGQLGERFQGLETPVGSYRSLVAWYAAVRKWCAEWFRDPLPIARAVMRLERVQLEQAHALGSAGLQKSIQQAVWNLSRLQEIGGNRLKNDWFGRWVDGADAAQELAENLEASLPQISEGLAASNIILDNAVADAKPYLRSALDRKRVTGRQTYLQGTHERTPLTDTEFRRLREGLRFAEAYWTNSACIAARSIIESAVDSDQLSPILESMKVMAPALATFREIANLHLPRLGATYEFLGEPMEEVPIDELLYRCEAAQEGERLFEEWVQLIESFRPSAAGVPWTELAEGVLHGNLTDEQAQETLRLGVLQNVLQRCMAVHPELREFEGFEHEEVRNRLREIDEALLGLHKEEIAHKAGSRRAPEGSSGSRVSDLTEMKLLRNETTKQRRHLPIRKLVNRASGALLALKPCFMMGPLSVAQYLAPGRVKFDILIMDEASQMKPEDALGAISRARQVIVVGDPKQLPPTSFFDRIDDGLDDDIEDAFTVQGKQSILELLMPVLGQVRQLNWHYRSRHESLIAFCNSQFYDDRLLAFPSPRREALWGSLGVTYHYVSGEYRQQRNQVEAEELLRSVLREIRASGGRRTVGVVAINSQQAELLNENWLRLLREHPEVEDLLSVLPDNEPFFIKNLENVQGDERDVIFISLTYGPDNSGNFYQRFGPINQENGWRRLNVLFSRARENMVIFSSMRSDRVTPTPGNLGAMALKQFLSFCERGGIIEVTPLSTSREPDSPFEIEVIKVLEQRGFRCVPQVGVAGFFVDIGIVDPESDGDYLLGIECDGATYHSAKSARDRDLLRQSILERLGWKIHRIWSPDWFRRRDQEVDRLMRAVEREHERTRRKRADRERELEKTIHVGPVVELSDNEAIARTHQESIESQPGVVQETSATAYMQSPQKPREQLRRALGRLKETIESEFPDIPVDRQLLRDEMLAFFVEHRPTDRDEFAISLPILMRQNVDVEQARRYLGTIFSLCEQYM